MESPTAGRDAIQENHRILPEGIGTNCGGATATSVIGGACLWYNVLTKEADAEIITVTYPADPSGAGINGNPGACSFIHRVNDGS